MNRSRLQTLGLVSGVWLALVLLHYPFRCLPYFWDEAGYYAFAARDFYQHQLLIPRSTWALGHTPLGAVYVASAWHLFGLSSCVARIAIVLIAAATVIATYKLGRHVFVAPGEREIAAWSAALLAISPLFFAQSTMLHIDLTATLFITLAVTAFLRGQMAGFALAASLAFLSKETAAIILPVFWLYAWRKRRKMWLRDWAWLLSPVLVGLAWAFYYHHETGFWTGNRAYLEYNLYSTLNPFRFLLSALRRLYQLLIGGFDWILIAGAIIAIRRKKGPAITRSVEPSRVEVRELMTLGGLLCAVYLVFHSMIGGALLRRYLLPIYPVFYLAAVWLVWRLPKTMARAVCTAAVVLFVVGWFVSEPYSSEFESSLAYADFVHLHEDAAKYLESHDQGARILTAWPATGELTEPFLGYVSKPLRVVKIDDFGDKNFTEASDFDLVYLYSRKPESVNRGLMRFSVIRRLNQRYFDYVPQISDENLVTRYHCRLLKSFERNRQWIRIYAKEAVQASSR